MKNIILVRHGKSSWTYNVHDKDRPLKERGINDAHKVAQKLKSQKVKIDAIYSSPANRALHTCMIFMRQLNLPFSKLTVKDALYDFSGEGVFYFVDNLPKDKDTIMIFGHNYAFTNVVNTWGDKYIENVPTSGLVHISFKDSSWDTLSKGTTEQTLFPKLLQ